MSRRDDHGRTDSPDTMAAGVIAGILATLAWQALIVGALVSLAALFGGTTATILAFLPGLTQILYMLPLIILSEGRSQRRRTLGLLSVAAVVLTLNGLVCGLMIASIGGSY